MTTFDLLIFYKRIGAQILEERLSLRTFLSTSSLWMSLVIDKGSSIVRSFSSNSGQPKNFCWESSISVWWKTGPNHYRSIWQLLRNEWMLAASKMVRPGSRAEQSLSRLLRGSLLLARSAAESGYIYPPSGDLYLSFCCLFQDNHPHP